MRVRTVKGHRLVTWWLPNDLLDWLTEYQHERRIKSLVAAAIVILREAREKQAQRPE